MSPLVVKIAAAIAGLAIFSGLYLGPTSTPRYVAVLFGLIGLAALLLAAVDYFHLLPS